MTDLVENTDNLTVEERKAEDDDAVAAERIAKWFLKKPIQRNIEDIVRHGERRTTKRDGTKYAYRLTTSNLCRYCRHVLNHFSQSAAAGLDSDYPVMRYPHFGSGAGLRTCVEKKGCRLCWMFLEHIEIRKEEDDSGRHEGQLQIALDTREGVEPGTQWYFRLSRPTMGAHEAPMARLVLCAIGTQGLAAHCCSF